MCVGPVFLIKSGYFKRIYCLHHFQCLPHHFPSINAIKTISCYSHYASFIGPSSSAVSRRTMMHRRLNSKATQDNIELYLLMTLLGRGVTIADDRLTALRETTLTTTRRSSHVRINALFTIWEHLVKGERNERDTLRALISSCCVLSDSLYFIFFLFASDIWHHTIGRMSIFLYYIAIIMLHIILSNI